MTEPTGTKTATNPPTAEDAEAEKQVQARKFLLPFLYGLATANFIALIQFAPTEPKPNRILPQNTGSLGMLLMSISIPALILYALHLEMAVRKRDSTKLSAGHLASIFTLGILGIALTLAAFHPFVGIVFFGATGAMLEWAVNRSRSKDRK